MASSSTPSGSEGKGSPISPQIIAGAVVAIGAVVFLAQNRKEVPVKFLFISIDMRVWTLIVISMVLGALLTWLLPKALRRKRE